MHKSEPKVNLVLITRADMVYEPKARYGLPHNSILKLIQHLITKNQLHSNILCK